MARGRAKSGARRGREAGRERNRPPRRADLLRAALAAHRRGDAPGAESHYRAFLERNPGQPDALHNLGLLLYQTGRLDEAVEPLREAARAKPHDLGCRVALGTLLRDRGRLDEARAVLERAVARAPEAVEAAYALGTVLHEAGDHEAAESHYRAVVEREPGHAGAWNSLGSLHLDRGENEAALECLDRALAADPRHAGAHVNRGIALARLGRVEEAEAAHRRALGLRPGLPEALNNLATVLRKLGRLDEAERRAREAVAARPGYASAWFNLGNICFDRDRIDSAIEAFRRCLDLEPDNVEALNQIGAALLTRGRMEEGRAALDRALELEPGYAPALNTIGFAHLTDGDLDEARRCFEGALERAPELPGAWLNLSKLRRFGPGDDETVAFVEAIGERGDLDDRARASLHFALAKMHHDRGDHERAFAHYRTGNALVRGMVEFDAAGFERRVEGILATMDHGFFAARAGWGAPSDLPIFVFGMPRSGTTLVEQILASHPAVTGAGELMNLPLLTLRLLREADPGATYAEAVARLSRDDARRHGDAVLAAMRRLGATPHVTDKLPGNYMHLGLIALLLPGARLVHCRRDPMDTCFSNYIQLFAEGHHYAYDLAELGLVYRGYARLMEHWREVLPVPMLEIDYEALVGDQEGESRRLLEFCGLPWDDRCLAFNETRRAVATASQLQVRQPIYRSAVARWRRYEPWLGELRAALGDLAPPPPAPPAPPPPDIAGAAGGG